MAFYWCRCGQMWREGRGGGIRSNSGTFCKNVNRGESKKFAQLTGASRPFMAGLKLERPGSGSSGARPLGDPSLSRSVCWQSLTPLTFSLSPYQNVFFSPTLQWKKRRSPPLLRSSCSTLWSDPIYKCDRRRSNSFEIPRRFFFLFFFLMSRNKFRMRGGRKKKKKKIMRAVEFAHHDSVRTQEARRRKVFYLVLRTWSVPT